MNDPFLVRRRESLGNLDRKLHRLADGQITGLEPVAQALALEKLRDKVGNGLVVPTS